MALKTFFSGGATLRSGEIRNDAEALQSLWHAPDTRFVVMHESRFIVRDGQALLLEGCEIHALAAPHESAYLGLRDGTHLFGVALAEPGADELDAAAFANFRGLLSDLPEDDAALLAYAKGVLEWQARHRFCGVCGGTNESRSGGFIMVCTDCGHKNFPRVDPAIIVLVHDGERCLLGQQRSWPEGRYSTVAGFVEPGESLEDAVRREVHEETNVTVGATEYLGSQPWPFPMGMMVGFHAQAESTDIALNDGELADALWITREQLATGKVVLPPVTSIAFRLIERWFDRDDSEWDGPGLADLNLSGDFSRRTGERT